MPAVKNPWFFRPFRCMAGAGLRKFSKQTKSARKSFSRAQDRTKKQNRGIRRTKCDPKKIIGGQRETDRWNSTIHAPPADLEKRGSLLCLFSLPYAIYKNES